MNRAKYTMLHREWRRRAHAVRREFRRSNRSETFERLMVELPRVAAVSDHNPPAPSLTIGAEWRFRKAHDLLDGWATHRRSLRRLDPRRLP